MHELGTVNMYRLFDSDANKTYKRCPAPLKLRNFEQRTDTYANRGTFFVLDKPAEMRWETLLNSACKSY